MNEVGLDEAYEKWADELVRFATVLVGPHDAADVVADGFVKLLGDEAAWTRVDRPRSYLFGVVANQARMRHRSGLRRRRRDDTVARPPVPSSDEPGDLPASDVLDNLSRQQRTFVYLAYWEDWTATDIARVCGVSEGTVRRQLARAREKLREELS